MNDNMSVYKPDWKEARQRMIDWWAGKKVDRAIALVSAPLDPPANPLRREFINDVPGKYIDEEIVFNNLEYGLERAFWGGEAFPRHYVYFGPMFGNAWLGCEPTFADKTTWYKPRYESIDDLADNFQFDRNNRWWLLTKEIIRRSTERSEGRYLTTLTGIGSIIDIVAGLIGESNCLIAMMETPEKVRTARDKIAVLGRETYEEICRITAEYRDGYIDWMKVWSDKPLRTNQCDLCVMISPDMFRDFVVDDLQSTYDYVDRAIYHLDGEEQIRHLDMLLAMEKIKVIQWVPSARANQPEYRDPMNWIDLFKRIQAAGKSVLISTPPERIRELLQKIDPGKVILTTSCPDRKTAEETLSTLDDIGV